MVSLKPSEATQGGLLDDVNVTWKKCRFAMFDYNGTLPPVPAIKVEMETEEGEEAEQYWSIGNAKDWKPSKDGKTLQPVGSASTLKLNSNGMILLKSLVDSGFDEEEMGDDVSVFDGIKVHMARVPAPKRSGLEKAPREDGKDFPATILTVDEILVMPGEEAEEKSTKTAAAKGKPKPKAGTAAKEKASDTSDAEAEATEYIIGKLAEAGGEGIPKKTLAVDAFRDLSDSANQQAIVQLIYTDEFLSSGPWKYEDGVVSM